MPDVLKILKAERDTLRKRLTGLEHAIVSLSGGVRKSVKKAVKKARKTMSAAARKKISIAQKARHAALRAANKAKKPG